MTIRLAGGRIIDPANGRDETGDLWIDGTRIVAAPPGGSANETIDCSGCIVMAGGIDIHSHIAGGNVNMARLMMPELGREPGKGWTTGETGRLYAQMGFTTVVEPAMAPQGALATHLELADIPYIDRGALAVLGNDEFTLRLLRDGGRSSELADYVGWSVAQARALGVKAINAGGVAAFKDNVRAFSFDDVVPGYGVTSRAIVEGLAAAVAELGIPHPLHVHCNNLGIAGNWKDAVETMEAAGPGGLHLAHLQFYGYGTEGKRKFSSAAPQLAEAVNGNRAVTVDVGQVMFGQTVTVSSDVLRQFDSRNAASPKKWIIWDGDGNGGGVVAYDYKRKSFVSALQWAIGLELFLLIDDPWRVFFTTDHPNGGHFSTYPEILHLLMSRDERASWIETMPQAAMKIAHLPGITREYTLNEIAIMTRAAPARLLGLADRGQLGVGAMADISVYHDQPDRTAMFRRATHVFKNGRAIMTPTGLQLPSTSATMTLSVRYDGMMDRRMARHLDDAHGLPPDAFAVPETLVPGTDSFEVHPCRV